MSGILIIDKPKGVTSFSIVNKIRKMTGIRKVGHAGTLDPLATGVLPVCLGEATKISDLIMGGDKTYEVRARLGERTDTLDADGRVLCRGEVDPTSVSREQIEKVLGELTGDISQVPPMFSAIKKDGVPLYELARKGREVEREKRQVRIHSIELLSLQMPYVELRVECSKGTYVRTLIDDMGSMLGTFAHVVELRRTRSGVFGIQEALSLSGDVLSLSGRTLPMEDVIRRIMPVSEVEPSIARMIALGHSVEPDNNALQAFFCRDKNGESKLVSINNGAKTFRVFNYAEWSGRDEKDNLLER